MLDKEHREWLMQTDFAEVMSRQADELYNIREAEPDQDGLIERPLLPLRDTVMFPHVVTPLFVGREQTMAAVAAANQDHQTIIGLTQLDPGTQDPQADDFYSVGVELAIGRTLRMPDGSNSVRAQGRRRIEIVEFTQIKPYMRVRARPLPETAPRNRETEALMRAVLALFEKCVHLNHKLPEEAYAFAMNVDEPGWLADLVTSALSLESHERQSVLEILDPAARLQRVSVLLGKELDVLELEDHIHSQVQQEVDKSQREFYLREQMKAIQTELGESDTWTKELVELREKVAAARMPEEVNKKANEEIERLTQMPAMAPEVGIIRTYLDWLIELPWSNATEDNLVVAHAARVLDRQHFGLPKAKDRILEYIAVRQLAADKMRSPILCFLGPPGTGKTSLGKSIADALGRKFVRVSLGGVRDEAEIRGHRRTYIGALPGRILQTMRRAGTINPLFMLDEIDKLGQDFRGDPSSALLEVLDPEQNKAFSDHYLDVDYDLSKVLFVTTANSMAPIPPALQDRMEVIEFPGYVVEEKLSIARAFLVPRQVEEHGLKGTPLIFTDGAVKTIIRQYTDEAGVRNLEREIATICRKVARRTAEGKRPPVRITPASLHRYLGPPRYSESEAEKTDQIGVATGVAWTESGGDTMPVEVQLMEGKGLVQITGQIGEVMQESAHAAMSFLRARAAQFGVSTRRFEKTDVHIHVPEGAVPKDGPSAGITIAISLISAFTGRKVRHDVGMTGEITLRGRVLPVGGIKEKVLAAHRAGIRTIVMPKKNEKDLIEIPKTARRELKFVFVEEMDEVLEAVLRKEDHELKRLRHRPTPRPAVKPVVRPPAPVNARRVPR
jgi:ATP-dependent Lon protease